MYATINLPGSTHFEKFGPASRRECEAWLDERDAWHRENHGGGWVSTYFPARILSNREAARMRYSDGTKVF
jgi:hypothetical protein